MMWGDDSLKLTPERSAFIKKCMEITSNIVRGDIQAAEILGKLAYVLSEIKGNELALELLQLFCKKGIQNGVAGFRLIKAYEQYCAGDLGRLYRTVVEEDPELRKFVLQQGDKYGS
jgi:hypothetical protein